MDKKQVTFADIAEYTGFSKTTISRFFNHPDTLTLENQEKISQALDALGYKKNKLASVLANGKSEFIGIIVPNLYLHYYSDVLTHLLSSYSEYHYKFLVFVSDKGAAEEEQYIDELMAYQIEGQGSGERGRGDTDRDVRQESVRKRRSYRQDIER